MDFTSGLRKSKIADGIKTEFYLDGGNVAAEKLTSSLVSGTNNYIFGIALLARSDASGVSNYLFNGHGDVVHLTGSSGAVTRTYDYDAFGNEKAASAGDGNPFRYCGEYFDRETGTYYLRARYYNPVTGRFVSEDPIRDGLNWYGYCSGNPVAFADYNGMQPYSVRATGSKNEGKYTLYVSPFCLDTVGSAASIGMGSLDPLIGVGYFVLNSIVMRLGGFREINYNISEDLPGLATSLTEYFAKNKILKGIGIWGGFVLDATEVATILYDYFLTQIYQIEEAIYNHFDRDIWVSATRNVVDRKFEYAMEKMTTLIIEGKGVIKKAIDVFGKDAFSDHGPTTGMATWQYDPLTGEYRLFLQDDYYFFMLDDSATGKVSDVENVISNPKIRWKAG